MMYDSSDFSLQSTAQDSSFYKILRQLAGQLWQSKLQETLHDSIVQKHLTDQECSSVSTYEQLFDTLVEKQLVTPLNITLLKTVLRNHESSGALLRAVYEAGFGKEGLISEDSVFDEQRRSSGNFRRPSFGHMKAMREFKALLRRIDSQLDSSDDLGALKLLCYSVLSLRQLEGISSALELCNALRRARCITLQKPEFLYRLLEDCGRWDLCDLVDGYVYTCEKTFSDSPSPEPRERKNSACRRIKYQFARALKNLGDQLGSDDLAMMKLLAGTYIPDSKLEKAKNIYEFLILLQERGKLSQKDLSFLEQLLDDKLHIVSSLYDLGFGCKAKPQKCHNSSSNDSLMNFKRLLKTIGSRLTSENIQQIKFLCSDDTRPVHSGIELLSFLEKRGEIGPNNLQFLMEALQEVGRRDLSIIVGTFINPTQGVQSLSSEVRNGQETQTKTLAQSTAAARTSSPVLNEGSTELLEKLTTSKEGCENDNGKHTTESQSSTNDLLKALSRQKLFQESELRDEYEQFKRTIVAELNKKDTQIEELTRKLNAQQTLLNRLALRLDLKDDDL